MASVVPLRGTRERVCPNPWVALRFTHGYSEVTATRSRGPRRPGGFVVPLRGTRERVNPSPWVALRFTHGYSEVTATRLRVWWR